MTREEYEKLCQEIWHHNYLYYVEHTPTISDEAFDHLLKKLEAIEQKHPDWVTPTSPTQRVNEFLTEGFMTVKHTHPMLSLANTYSKEEVEDFVKRVEKLLGHAKSTFCTELKMDGIAISARFEKGQLTRAVTRGDGKKGDDITVNFRTVTSVPLQLYGKNIPDVIEVRGEVFMPHKAFLRLNEARKKEEEPLWANPRNAAAGSLKLLDPKEVAKRGLQCMFYGIAELSDAEVTEQFESHQFLKQLGLPILPHIALCQTIEEIFVFAEKIKQLRSTLPFDIDGIVIKCNQLRDQKKLGMTGKSPRWAVAYKFAAEQAITQIQDITVQVGRTGVFTPVAELTPIFLAGSTISRATLHNAEEVERKDIRIGDTVIIEKGGDVIPKVVEVLLDKRPHISHVWHMPKNCPSCGAHALKVEGEVAVRCPNSEHCPEQILRRLIFFAGKDGMDIEGLGDKITAQLYHKKFVKRPSDIYTLTEDHLSQLDGFKEKSIHNLLHSIEASKKVPLPKIIMALGIKHVGIGTAELLAARAGSIEKLMTFQEEDLLKIEGIGEKVAGAILDYFSKKENREEIARLLSLGVQPQQLEVQQFTGHPFEGKIFVLTGTLEYYTRNDAAALIKERGGKVTDSVSKKTDYLLAGDSAGSKLDKAKTLGITILDEKEWMGML